MNNKVKSKEQIEKINNNSYFNNLDDYYKNIIKEFNELIDSISENDINESNVSYNEFLNKYEKLNEERKNINKYIEYLASEFKNESIYIDAWINVNICIDILIVNCEVCLERFDKIKNFEKFNIYYKEIDELLNNLRNKNGELELNDYLYKFINLNK